MYSKSKGYRCEYLSETISAIFELKKVNQLYSEIGHHFKISKSSMTNIIYKEPRQSEYPIQSNKRPGCPFKLDAQAQYVIICYVEKYSHDNLHILSTPFKSGYNISWMTI